MRSLAHILPTAPIDGWSALKVLHMLSKLYDNYVALYYIYNFSCKYNYNHDFNHAILVTLHYRYNNHYNYTTLDYSNYTTLQIQLHYTTLDYTTTTATTTTTTALHHTTSSSCGWGDHCNHSKKHKSNHLSIHQWIRSAIRASRQPTSPIGFLSLQLWDLLAWL